MSRHMWIWGFWVFLVAVVVTAISLAASSPLQLSRDTAYVAGGMAGVVGLGLLAVQPLLAAGVVPVLKKTTAWLVHRLVGSLFVALVLVHIVGLYIYSPQDMTDALLLAAPTLFSIYGVIGLWATILTAILVAFRLKFGVGYKKWRVIHNVLAVVAVVSSVVHALMIEGAMEPYTKQILCAAVLLVTTFVIAKVHLSKGVGNSNLKPTGVTHHDGP